jgi:hypothetical protein
MDIWQHFKENKKIVILETVALILFAMAFYGISLITWAYYRPI